MLQMKKNTGAKIAALVASVAAAASIFGLVRQSAPVAASTAPAQVQPNVAPSTNSNSTASTQTNSATTTARPRVTTRTRTS